MDKRYEWQQHAETYMAVGSRVTCNPPPTDTDEDWIVYDPDWKLANWLSEDGFDLGGSDSEVDADTWASFTKGDLNVICIKVLKEYNSFILSTLVCKELNVMEKEHRKLVFDAVMYGVIK